ncbi:glycosyltransferase family 4 protein [Alteromonas sp. 1_MG-2023]|uniref:glycosyltransferase family 4 protein n=1 Tax=Alteromonas sp. 1_MG-2023 TaxID=3062669 RepID=UPI0026E14353|nr:glycosyltransferase family 4 protein [Alteromonas sp. 1_MG-2023]MDO6566322.1 glycosyltransferase family 4 protein [Alteromonas sp. 1_MG-2023]
MINVLHVTFDMRIGGTEMVIKNIIEGNTDANIKMSIYCIESPLGPWGEELKNSGFAITIKERNPGFDTTLIKAIRKHIKENNIDVLHCHQYTPWVYGALAAAYTNTKVIFTEHGRFYPDSRSWKRRIINPILLKLSDKVTAISEATKQALIDYEYIPENDIEVVYNGIATLSVETSREQTRSELSIPDDAFIFGTIARLDPIKNQTMMIRAFANVVPVLKNVFLVIVGDGEMRKPLELLVNKLGIEQNVIFTGYISKPAALLNSFDVFLLSSLSEGTSMTLLEAMALSKPCVVTDAGGNAEVIRHKLNGLVSLNDDVDSFTQNMIEATREELSEQFATHAIAIFHQNFAVGVMLKKYLKGYRELHQNA